jgi:hypothetical protein
VWPNSRLNKNHDRQATDIEKYSIENWTTKIWKQMPAEALAAFRFRSHFFKKRFREVFISEVK